MARASTPTLLSLDDFAQQLGINPAHFNGAYGGDTIFQHCGDCKDMWSQYSWQCTTGLNRERLAMTIAEAEQQVSNYLLKPLVPQMRTKIFQYRNHTCYSPNGKPGYYIGDHIENYKPYVWESFIDVNADDESFLYYDLDGDGFAEVGVLSFSSEDLVSACDFGVFYSGHFGQATWKISPVKKTTITHNSLTGNWDVEIHIETWKLIDPEQWEELPSESNTVGCCMRAIDMADSDRLVTELHVGKLVQSVSFPLVEYVYEKSVGCCSDPDCQACTVNISYGCYTDLTRESGIVVPSPATFDEDTNSWCETTTVATCTSVPKMVRINYWVGCTDEYEGNDECGDCLNPALKQIIAYLAMARLQMGECECECNSGGQWRKLGEDLSFNKGGSRLMSYEVLNNPFGMLRGEVMAWQRLRAHVGNRPNVTYGGF